MSKRVSLLICAFAFMFLAACAGSKTSGGSSYYDDSEDGGGYGGGGGRGSGEARAPRADELKDAKNEATALTEENHKLAKEIFDLKNKLGMPTDE
jgi:hypothetical protein